ncbi:redox-regulated ATPase YchF [bacterium endosymbiont of Pedicinus badii]|uniref:redox-regulated ATPase YchF n=1 Tax=bacterium endosymbiont of Pedicinus badii TaxID=1719126 RepID=UPI0009CCCAF3|nr:redox-regulated ATPase YchF [bacterium endosymbiont of Pedicinus badii]OQM34378.1 hypothetical protein AOQ89_00600 [bacterium endosymbiont of Pedicinus badii]
MGFKCGIIGFPNVGKSTLFNSLTSMNVNSKNFPFCTIEPNIGKAILFDERIELLQSIVKSKKNTYSTIDFFDIAGLIKNSYKGEGLGNKFLSQIRLSNALLHVVLCFQNKDIFHINGNISPINDIDTINTELILSDLLLCEKYIKNQDEKKESCILEKCFKYLNEGNLLRKSHFSEVEKKEVQKLNFLTFKPTIYILNKNENKNRLHNTECKKLEKVKSYLKSEKFITICIKKEFLDCRKNLNNQYYKNKKLNQIIYLTYKMLNLKTFFTVGEKEIKSWTIKKDCNAFQAAKKIHSDIQRGFIRAEVVSYKDYVNCKGIKNARNFGKIRLEGKNYIIKDGDIIKFLFKI